MLNNLCDCSHSSLWFVKFFVEFLLWCGTPGIFPHKWQQFEWMLRQCSSLSVHTLHNTLTNMLPSIHLLALWRQGCHQSWRRLHEIFWILDSEWKEASMHARAHTHMHTHAVPSCWLSLGSVLEPELMWLFSCLIKTNRHSLSSLSCGQTAPRFGF